MQDNVVWVARFLHSNGHKVIQMMLLVPTAAAAHTKKQKKTEIWKKICYPFYETMIDVADNLAPKSSKSFNSKKDKSVDSKKKAK